MIWYVLGALVTLILWMLVVVLVGLARVSELEEEVLELGRRLWRLEVVPPPWPLPRRGTPPPWPPPRSLPPFNGYTLATLNFPGHPHEEEAGQEGHEKLTCLSF